MLIRCRIDSLVMIDDFLFAGERLQTQSDLEFLIREFGRLGLEVKPGKTELGPAVTFLGVLYDVPRQTAYMTAARLAKHALLLQHISDSLNGLTDKVHTAVVASFVHVALFSAPVVDGGRLHLDALLAVANSDCITVSWTPAMQEEFYFWEKLVPVIHGACWSKAESRRLIPEGHVSSDASFEPLSSSGYGFHWQGQVRHRIFSKEQLQYFLSCQPINPIAILELFALVQTIRCFGAQWQGCRVIHLIDNTTAGFWVNKLASRQGAASSLLKTLWWLLRTFDIELIAVYIDTSSNCISDLASRLGQDANARLRLLHILKTFAERSGERYAISRDANVSGRELRAMRSVRMTRITRAALP